MLDHLACALRATETPKFPPRSYSRGGFVSGALTPAANLGAG